MVRVSNNQKKNYFKLTKFGLSIWIEHYKWIDHHRGRFKENLLYFNDGGLKFASGGRGWSIGATDDIP